MSAGRTRPHADPNILRGELAAIAAEMNTDNKAAAYGNRGAAIETLMEARRGKRELRNIACANVLRFGKGQESKNHKARIEPQYFPPPYEKQLHILTRIRTFDQPRRWPDGGPGRNGRMRAHSEAAADAGGCFDPVAVAPVSPSGLDKAPARSCRRSSPGRSIWRTRTRAAPR